MFHLKFVRHYHVLVQEVKAVIHLAFEAGSGNFQSISNVNFCAEPEACVRENVFEAIQRMHLR